MTYDWDFGPIQGYSRAIMHGFVTTLALSACVVIAGTPLGFFYAILIRLAPRWLRIILVSCMDVIRALPILIVIFLCYYLLPILLTQASLSSFWLAWFALTLYLAAFAADVVRGALDTIPRQYVEAGQAVGLTASTIFFLIEIRWVARTTLPAFALLWIGMVKNSSLASIIGVYELTHTANAIIANTFRSVETYAIVGLMYIVVILPFALFARRLERALGERKEPHDPGA